MSALGTVFPLGLNDKIGAFGMHGNCTNGSVNGYNMYGVVNICINKKKAQRNRHKKKNRGKIDDSGLDDFRNEVLSLAESQLCKLECLIRSKSRVFLERFVNSVYFNGIGKKVSFLIKSFVDFFRKVKPVRNKIPDIQCNVDFSHKIFDDININSIFNNKNVKNLLPSSLRGRFRLKIVYRFGKTIGGKILNYNNVLRDLNVPDFDHIMRMSCDCETSAFKHGYFGHIITGDLDIIQNGELRRLCSFGTKFRENPILRTPKIIAGISKNLDSLIGR